MSHSDECNHSTLDILNCCTSTLSKSNGSRASIIWSGWLLLTTSIFEINEHECIYIAKVTFNYINFVSKCYTWLASRHLLYLAMFYREFLCVCVCVCMCVIVAGPFNQENLCPGEC